MFASIPIDTPGEYARRLLDRLGDRDMLDVLDSSPAAIRRAFDGVADEAIRTPEAPGKWAMIDVAHHLARTIHEAFCCGGRCKAVCFVRQRFRSST